MELRHLRYFVVAAEEENFHRAAKRLFVAQTAISRRIQDLEAELGVQLFDRHQKRVTLSRIGRSYFQDINRSLKEIELAGEKARLMAKGEVGMLSVGFHDTAIRCSVVETAFHEFRTKYPGIELKLDPLLPAALVDAILHGAVDAAFIYDDCFPADLRSLDMFEIAVTDYLIALPSEHPLVRHERLKLSDLKDVGFVWSRRDTSPTTHDRLIAACQAGGLTPRIVQNAPNESTRMQLVTMGVGASFVLSSNTTQNTSGRVALRRVEGFDVPVHLYLVWRRENNSPALERFIDSVRVSHQASVSSSVAKVTDATLRRAAARSLGSKSA